MYMISEISSSIWPCFKSIVSLKSDYTNFLLNGRSGQPLFINWFRASIFLPMAIFNTIEYVYVYLYRCVIDYITILVDWHLPLLPWWIQFGFSGTFWSVGSLFQAVVFALSQVPNYSATIKKIHVFFSSCISESHSHRFTHYSCIRWLQASREAVASVIHLAGAIIAYTY